MYCFLVNFVCLTWGRATVCLVHFSLIPLLLEGETIRIVIEDYVQHLSGYLLQLKFDPTLLFGSPFQYGNRIALEFSQLYHWHPLMPDSFLINGDELSYEQFLFNTSVLTHYGVEALVDSFSRQIVGQVANGTCCVIVTHSYGAFLQVRVVWTSVFYNSLCNHQQLKCCTIQWSMFKDFWQSHKVFLFCFIILCEWSHADSLFSYW